MAINASFFCILWSTERRSDVVSHSCITPIISSPGPVLASTYLCSCCVWLGPGPRERLKFRQRANFVVSLCTTTAAAAAATTSDGG